MAILRSSIADSEASRILALVANNPTVDVSATTLSLSSGGDAFIMRGLFLFNVPGQARGRLDTIEFVFGGRVVYSIDDINADMRDVEAVLGSPDPNALFEFVFDGNDTLFGSGFEDFLQGFDGRDVLVGGAGVDVLEGGDGDDRLDGGAGGDSMSGGRGGDIYNVDDVRDIVFEAASDPGVDRINTFVDFTNPENVEFLVGLFADEGLRLIGNEGRDRITGSSIIAEGDIIAGLGGGDRLVGLVGNDIIDGGRGNDRIFGNSGDDVIRGAHGNDKLTGQFGQDTFFHKPGHGRDGITDFDVDQDILDLTRHDFNSFAEVEAQLGDTARGVFLDLSGGPFQGLASTEGIVFENTTLATFQLGSEDVLI